MKIKFRKGNLQQYSQDFCVFRGIPHGIYFEISYLTIDRMKLTAPGYGLPKEYGNGSIYIAVSHLTTAQRKQLKKQKKEESNENNKKYFKRI